MARQGGPGRGAEKVQKNNYFGRRKTKNIREDSNKGQPKNRNKQNSKIFSAPKKSKKYLRRALRGSKKTAIEEIEKYVRPWKFQKSTSGEQ
jgi:hypothetical protein